MATQHCSNRCERVTVTNAIRAPPRPHSRRGRRVAHQAQNAQRLARLASTDAGELCPRILNGASERRPRIWRRRCCAGQQPIDLEPLQLVTHSADRVDAREGAPRLRRVAQRNGATTAALQISKRPWQGSPRPGAAAAGVRYDRCRGHLATSGVA